ncbi:MAG: hypothetical protein LUI14_05880 [Lachnospiraceae bacterium]|nr:hypothetical protein [Lachnospiraceae bacterium]
MKEYKIDKELEKLMPKLTEDETVKLEESIKIHGYKGAPIFVWKEQGVIIDGHNRYELCKKLGYTPEIEELSFENKEQVIQWIIYTQLGRRNLPDGQKIHYARMLRPKLEQEAKERQRKAGGDRKSQKYKESNPPRNGGDVEAGAVTPQNGGDEGTRTNPPRNGASDKHKNEVTTQLAEMAGMKREKFRMGEAVLNSDNEQLKADMRNGTKTVSGAYKELKRQKQNDASAHELQRLKESGREIHLPEQEEIPEPAAVDIPAAPASDSLAAHLDYLKDCMDRFCAIMQPEEAWLKSKKYYRGSQEYYSEKKDETHKVIGDSLYVMRRLRNLISAMEPINGANENLILINRAKQEEE